MKKQFIIISLILLCTLYGCSSTKTVELSQYEELQSKYDDLQVQYNDLQTDYELLDEKLSQATSEIRQRNLSYYNKQDAEYQDWLNSLSSDEKAIYDEAYNKGKEDGELFSYEDYDEGYKEGYNDGKGDGEEDGYDFGYEEGYDRGYIKGLADAD